MARTEGDTWDLASSVGATATGVAASRALAIRTARSAHRRSRTPSRWCAPSASTSSSGSLDGEIGVRATIRCSTPQRMCEQIAVRTRFFDDFFTDAAAAGIRQAVILASGLDTRAYRLPWPAGHRRVRDRPARR